MIPMGSVGSEQRRIRTGILVLVGGAVLVLWASASWIYRSSAESKALAAMRSGNRGSAIPNDLGEPVSALGTLLIYALILLAVVLIGSLVLSRSVRQYFGRIRKTQSGQTPSGDIWSQHRLPDDGNPASDESQP